MHGRGTVGTTNSLVLMITQSALQYTFSIPTFKQWIYVQHFIYHALFTHCCYSRKRQFGLAQGDWGLTRYLLRHSRPNLYLYIFTFSCTGFHICAFSAKCGFSCMHRRERLGYRVYETLTEYKDGQHVSTSNHYLSCPPCKMSNLWCRQTQRKFRQNVK